jgi:cell wall assembly regulator SMI1
MYSISDIQRVMMVRRSVNNIVASPGASEMDITNSELRLGLQFPEELKVWLKTYNHVTTTFGTILGVSLTSEPQEGSIEQSLAFQTHSGWKENGWLPVADDGCGSSYVAVLSKSKRAAPIAFIDFANNARLDYAVASSFYAFLRGFFLKDVNAENQVLASRWPFDKTIALENDPGLAGVSIAPLPWDVADEA